MKNTLSIILIYFTQILYAECSDLTQADCEYWSAYCQWNSDANVCEEVGGGGGGNTNYGPYEVANYSQEDGMQLGTQYADVTIYYPEEYNGLLGSIILGAGWSGDQGSMADWAYYFSSYGFVSATIQYNDPDNDSHSFRAEAILELISSIKMENDRTSSQLYNSLDTNEFAVVGYSLSGGSVQLAAVLDSTLSAVIALNPTIIVEDCDVCAGSNYCICLVPELLEHEVPTLIIAGQNEVDELPSYDGLLGQDQYYNTPGTTTKMLYEIANGSHGSASFPSATGGQPAKLALHWLNYFIQNKEEYCDSLIVTPEDASQFVTTLECGQGPPPPPPVQNIGYLRSADISFCMDECGMYYLESEEGEFLTNITNQNNIPYFDNYIDRFVEIEGDNVQCVECTAKNVDSIILSNNCQNPVSCFVDPCTVGSCSSNENAYCQANYCGDCFADYYENNDYIACDTPSGIYDLTGIDFGDCEMALGFGWVNNHCEAISGCGYIVNDVNYSGDIYSSLFECISASTLSIDKLFPLSFNLNQNHPNPFNPKTTISYQLAKDTNVRIIVHDMLGRLVKTLVNQQQGPGYHMVSWNATNNRNEYVSSGLYFYTIQAGNFSLTKKMVLLD